MKTPDQPSPADTLEAWESWLAWLEDYHNNYDPRLGKRHQAKVALDIREAIDRAELVIVTKRGSGG